MNKSRLILSSDAEQTRRRLTAELYKAYEVASNYARGKIKYVVGEDGKQHPITLAECRNWVVAAAQTAEIIKSLTQGIDEQKLYQDLDMLDAVVRKTTVGKIKFAGDSGVDV